MAFRSESGQDSCSGTGGAQPSKPKQLRSAMEAGPWTGQGYSAPWMYHSVAGQYTLLEKQLVSDWSCPCRHRPSPRVLQDSTNWRRDAPRPARWDPLRQQEGYWFPRKELTRTISSPKAQRQCSPTFDGLRPARRRDLSWGACPTAKEGFAGNLAGRAAAANCRWNQGAPGKSKADVLARAPPSYEAHMLLRLRAGEGPRKENWPRPPPYVAPPAYEAPHRTVQQPQQRVCSREASAVKQSPAEAPQKRRERAVACEAGPGRKAGRCHVKLPGGWSYLSGARTWGGARMPLPERAEGSSHLAPGRDRSPQRRSHTLPRASKRSQGVPVPCQGLPNDGPPPQHTLPAGWGFSHAVGWPGGALGGPGGRGAGKQSTDLLPKCKGGPSLAREQGPSGVAATTTPQRPAAGGLFVIDATCVVIQAHYIPAPRTEHVRYLGRERAEKVKAATVPCSPARVSMEERAARILGLPLGDLGFAQTGGKASAPEIPGHRLGGSCPADVAVPVAADAYGVGPPGGLPSPRRSPRKPLLAPAPNSFQVGPTEQEPGGCSNERGVPVPCQGGEGCPPQGEEEPLFSVPSRSYVQDLKEAMSRIRRHTAPDSDTDEELEKEGDGEPACGQSRAWRGHLSEGTLSYSSSSLESSSSNTTVVPWNATPTLRKGPQSDSELMLNTGDEAGQAAP